MGMSSTRRARSSTDQAFPEKRWLSNIFAFSSTKWGSPTARGRERCARPGRRQRSTNSGRKMLSTRASSPAEPELRLTTSKGSSCRRPRRLEITRSTRPTPLSRRRQKHKEEEDDETFRFFCDRIVNDRIDDDRMQSLTVEDAAGREKRY